MNKGEGELAGNSGKFWKKKVERKKNKEFSSLWMLFLDCYIHKNLVIRMNNKWVRRMHKGYDDFQINMAAFNEE